MNVRKAYVDGPFGQLHLRSTPAVASSPPLVALHATAYSSQSFLPLMAALEDKRQVVAIDAPGYGESDQPGAALGMGEYAKAIGSAVSAHGNGPVDLLGYHTGAYMAAELAIQCPELVRRLVLIGIPYFEALGVEEWRAKLCREHTLGETLDQFSERWSYFVTNRDPRVALDRAFANFVDELKAWPEGSAAHKAMFDWGANTRLPQISQPVLVLNPQGHLSKASRHAAHLIGDCTVRELPKLDGPVLEVAAREIAQEMDAWLGIEEPDSNRIAVGIPSHN